MRQIIERNRAAAAQARAQMNPQPDAPADEQPGTPNNGQPSTPPEQPADPQLSPNAQQRFGQLTQTLRQKDQELQATTARLKQAEQAAAADRQRAEAAERRSQELVQQHLDHMSPEERAAVLQDVRLREEIQGLEGRLMAQIAPVLSGVTERTVQADRAKLADKYQRYDPQVHDPLIDIFRGQNPNCTVEQAFRAIAEPEELVVSKGRAPAPPPPIANPSPGNAPPRYVPQQTQQTSPEQEYEEDRKRAFDLARSTKAQDRRHVGPAFDRFIRAKLGNALPDSQPTYRRR